MTEKRIDQIIRESVSRLLRENEQGEGTDKQNAYLKKLMGDRWKDEYAQLGVKETSAMIDKELGKAPGAPNPGYEVVDTLVSNGAEIYPCKTFPEAKKKLQEVIDEYGDVGFFSSPDLRFVKESDICYAVYGRNSRNCYGRVYIRKKKGPVTEGFKNWAVAGALGAASLFGNPQSAQAGNVQQQNKADTVQVQQQQLGIKQLKKLFPMAYKDRKAGPNVWKQNQKSYVATLPNGKISLVGKIAASYGENPWDALVKKYCPSEYDKKIFKLGDFDIQ